MGLALGRIAVAAGRPMIDSYRTGVFVNTKSGASPVTEADLAAEKMILEGLGILLPEIPVVSEEQTETRKLGPDEPFVLVDPLDGTREFIAKRDRVHDHHRSDRERPAPLRTPTTPRLSGSSGIPELIASGPISLPEAT